MELREHVLYNEAMNGIHRHSIFSFNIQARMINNHEANPIFLQIGTLTGYSIIINLERWQIYKPINYGRCYRCGANDHSAKFCHTHNLSITCFYPLCDKPETHVIFACQNLMGVCYLCNCRGHKAKHHEQYNREELAAIFHQWAEQGQDTRLSFDHPVWGEGDVRYGYGPISRTPRDIPALSNHEKKT